MSLFLQTFGFSRHMFREQEHRQERPGVAMALWPEQGLQEEKKRMKSRLATSIRCSFLRMNPRGRILVSTLLVVIVTAAAGAQTAPAISSTDARKAIEAAYVVFGKAAVGPMDKNTMERMLAPDLYVQTATRRATRQEYLDYLYTRPLTLTRFDATVLTVEPRGNDWAVLVFEKLEGQLKDKSGKTSKLYIWGVARDGWGQRKDDQWTVLFSEELGGPQTSEEIPPIANW
jgi:hypothetical protein